MCVGNKKIILYNQNDGSTYTGAWNRNNMHGFGVLEQANGCKYEGDFVQNLREGTGVFNENVY